MSSVAGRRRQNVADDEHGTTPSSPHSPTPSSPAPVPLPPQNALFGAVWHACAAPLVLVDPAATIFAANPAFAVLTGTAVTDMVGRPAWEFLPAEIGMAALAGASTEVTTAWSVPEHVVADAMGNRRRITWSLAAINPAPGRPTLVLATGVDLTPERLVQATLREKAERDPLTGLANRAYLMRALASCLDPFHGAGASVLFADLDRFKQVNDTHGHAAGDAVLREVAHRLTHLIRPEDIAARFGGDEFVVLIPAGGGFDAHRLITRLERALTRPIRIPDHGTKPRTIRIGVSIGVRVADVGQDSEQVLHEADTAMYAVKQARRATTTHDHHTIRRAHTKSGLPC